MAVGSQDVRPVSYMETCCNWSRHVCVCQHDSTVVSLLTNPKQSCIVPLTTQRHKPIVMYQDTKYIVALWRVALGDHKLFPLFRRNIVLAQWRIQGHTDDVQGGGGGVLVNVFTPPPPSGNPVSAPAVGRPMMT